MTVIRPAAIVWAWLIGLSLVGAALLAFALLDDTPTPFEREAMAELAELEAAPPGAVRIVILGNSIMRRATADDPSIDAVLAEQGFEVSVANISGGSRWFDSYERLDESIFTADPDIVIMQVEMFGSPLRGSETDLRSRVSRRLGLEDAPATYFRQRCRPGRGLDDLAQGVPDRLALPAPGLDWGMSFIAEAQRRGVKVYLLPVPRSDELEAIVAAPLDAFHAEVVATLNRSDAVTTGPRVSVGTNEYFCDFVHMNVTGQAEFLRQVVPDLVRLLDEVTPR